MSVYPGKGGQKYIQSTEDKMIEFLSLNKNKNILLGVDGGIKSETIRGAYNAGARRVTNWQKKSRGVPTVAWI